MSRATCGATYTAFRMSLPRSLFELRRTSRSSRYACRESALLENAPPTRIAQLLAVLRCVVRLRPCDAGKHLVEGDRGCAVRDGFDARSGIQAGQAGEDQIELRLHA